MKTKAEAVVALKAALEAPSVPKGACGGCGRAYVVLSASNDRKTVNAFAAAARDLGKLFLRKAYGTGNNALYVGYDNARGDMLAKADAVAASLNSSGFACYADAVAD